MTGGHVAAKNLAVCTKLRAICEIKLENSAELVISPLLIAVKTPVAPQRFLLLIELRRGLAKILVGFRRQRCVLIYLWFCFLRVNIK